MTNDEVLQFITSCTVKPALFEPGEAKFWNHPHISKSMLEAHLDPLHDAASRNPGAISRTVKHLLETNVLQPGMKVLDLGCGPGLYAEQMSRAGLHVVGLDISERSIEYAAKQARQSGLDIEYHCANFFDITYKNEFDVVTQVYGELCTFSDNARDDLLRLIDTALKPDGVFVFDVSTRRLRMKNGLHNHWDISGGGFWRPTTHLVLEQGFDYPEHEVWLDQYVIVDENGAKVYRNWFHDYSFDSISTVLASQGFSIKYVWNDLEGSEFTDGGDWIAIVAAT